MPTFNSNGKLLLTGEYAVLDGAKALAIPTRYGQELIANPGPQGKISWISRDHQGQVWFEGQFEVSRSEVVAGNANPQSELLTQVLAKANRLNPGFLETGWKVSTQLDFPENWGLGSSSTLINNVANWTSTNPYELLAQSFGGSGYDIAAAQHDQPILFQRKADQIMVEPVSLNWSFEDELFFVYLNRKQSSRDAISSYRKLDNQVDVEMISRLTHALLKCTALDDFTRIMTQHEELLSQWLQLHTIREVLFPDYPGLVKSLGAWGGDFILANGSKPERSYFQNKGYDTVIPFPEMIK